MYGDVNPVGGRFHEGFTVEKEEVECPSLRGSPLEDWMFCSNVWLNVKIPNDY